MRQPEEGNAESAVLNDQLRFKIFNEQIMPVEYGSLQAPAVPSVHYIGGQPGAGKTFLQAQIRLQLSERDGEHTVMEINNDRLRVYHPDYFELQRANDQQASYLTNPDADQWVQMAIEESIRLRPHVLLESSLRKPDEIIARAQKYKDLGYGSELHLVVTDELTSFMGVVRRYLGQVAKNEPARYVLKTVHDEAYTVLPASMAQLASSRVFTDTILHDRAGNLLASFLDREQTVSPQTIVNTLIEERSRQAGAIDRELMKLEMGRLITEAESHGRHECAMDLRAVLDRLLKID